MKTKILTAAAAIAISALIASACSSDSGDSEPNPTAPTTSSTAASTPTSASVSEATTAVTASTAAPAASGTETTTTATSAAASTTTASVPGEETEISEPPSTTSTSTTTTTSTSTTTTTTTTVAPPTTVAPSVGDLRVQVLNGSGIAGAAGRLTARLEAAGYVMAPAANAGGRFGSSAVYYSHEIFADEAAEIALAAGVDGVVSLAMPDPAPFVTDEPDVYVVVLIGADDLGGSLRPPPAPAGLRPRPRSDVAMPLPADVPRDRFVPGLANIQIFSAVNDNSPIEEVRGNLDAISRILNVIGRYSAPGSGQNHPDRTEDQDYDYLQDLYQSLERAFEYFGLTPQNVCGAPAGYSFTDLLKPTREWNEETQTYAGDAIFTTDRLIELHGGARINPETNLDFYIRQAVQTSYDHLRLAELLDETEAPQLILCWAWVAASGEVPEFANGVWYANLFPGLRPRDSLLSQGTYHLKEISKNGNRAKVFVCHPALGARGLTLYWREAGYRAEVVGDGDNEPSDCQGAFEEYDYNADHENEPAFKYSFGERVFSASDQAEFPRA